MIPVEKYFKDFEVNDLNADILDEYYLLKNKNDQIFIKSEFFVMTIFTLGPKWAEHLFSDIYNQNPDTNEIVNEVKNFNGYAININYNDTYFNNAILIPEENKSHKVSQIEKQQNESIDMSNVVIRVLKKKVPLDFIEKLGSSSQFLLSEDEKLEVELIQNDKIIGKGILEKLEDGYSLEVTEVLI